METNKLSTPFLGQAKHLEYWVNKTNDKVVHSMMRPEILQWLCTNAKPITLRLYLYILYKLIPFEGVHVKIDMLEVRNYLEVSKETIYVGLNELWSVSILSKTGKGYWAFSPMQMFLGDRSKIPSFGATENNDNLWNEVENSDLEIS